MRKSGLWAETYGEAVRLGNADHRRCHRTPSGSTALRISPNEQVAFLKRLHDNQLGLSERTAQLTRQITIAEQTPQGTLRAKTGACRPDGEREVTLWYVGYVEKSAGVWYFALELGDTDYDPLMAQRVPKARAILADLGVLPRSQ